MLVYALEAVAPARVVWRLWSLHLISAVGGTSFTERVATGTVQRFSVAQCSVLLL